MGIERFEDIEAWQAARKLTSSIYSVTREEPVSRDFGLRDQVQRAAVSIMANIAEGFDARSDTEFLRFLNYAYRSATELQSHLYVIRDQRYVDESTFASLYEEATVVKRLINGFIRYLRSDPKPRAMTTDPGRRTADPKGGC